MQPDSPVSAVRSSAGAFGLRDACKTELASELCRDTIDWILLDLNLAKENHIGLLSRKDDLRMGRMVWDGPMSWLFRGISGRFLPSLRTCARCGGFVWRLINICNYSRATVFAKLLLMSPGDISGPRATGKRPFCIPPILKSSFLHNSPRTIRPKGLALFANKLIWKNLDLRQRCLRQLVAVSPQAPAAPSMQIRRARPGLRCLWPARLGLGKASAARSALGLASAAFGERIVSANISSRIHKLASEITCRNVSSAYNDDDTRKACREMCNCRWLSGQTPYCSIEI